MELVILVYQLSCRIMARSPSHWTGDEVIRREGQRSKAGRRGRKKRRKPLSLTYMSPGFQYRDTSTEVTACWMLWSSDRTCEGEDACELRRRWGWCSGLWFFHSRVFRSQNILPTIKRKTTWVFLQFT